MEKAVVGEGRGGQGRVVDVERPRRRARPLRPQEARPLPLGGVSVATVTILKAWAAKRAAAACACHNVKSVERNCTCKANGCLSATGRANH